MKPQAVFVRLCTRPIPRVLRMMLVAKDLGYEPLFVGAFRDEGLSDHDTWDGYEVQRVGPYFPLVNGRRPALYVASVLRFGLAVMLRLARLRPAVVHVSDFEAYWPCRLYAAVTRTPLIFNIHDNLSQRYQCPSWAAAILRTLEGLAARLATVTVVPEEFRRTALPAWCRANVRVVKNAPVDPGFHAPNPKEPGRVSVLFAGWLDVKRGLDPLIEMVGASADCRLVVAGEGDRDLAQRAERAPHVEFLGYLANEHAIRETEKCDFVAALYDPVRPINRFAASNKIAEALAVGRPLIINREQEIAGFLEGYDCAVIVGYDEIRAIGSTLREIREDTERYDAMCRRGRQAYEEHYLWEIVYTASMKVFAAAGADVVRNREEGAARLEARTAHE